MISNQQIEQMQKKAKVRYTLMCVFAVVIWLAGVALLGYYAFFSGEEMEISEKLGLVLALPLGLALGGGYLFYILFVRTAYEQFNLCFKTQYVMPTVESTGYFQDLSYNPHLGLSYTEIRDGAVVGCGESRYFHSEDLLKGTYQNIRFHYCDVKTQYMSRSGKKQEVRTIFEGQVMRFASFNQSKRSFGHLQIFEKEFLSNLEGWTAQNKIETEDEAFNKRFQIFAADSHNAFYILTPRMLEQITRFADAMGEQIAITFTGPVMYVAVCRTRSIFDGDVDKPISSQREDILQDVEMLRKAGELLITEMNTIDGNL